MKQDFSHRLQTMQAAFAADPHNASLRSTLQDYFDDLRVCAQENLQLPVGELTRAALSLLRKFRNAQPPNPAEAAVTVDLTAMCEDLAFACDLLCDGRNRRIYCANAETVFSVCRPRAVLWAVLNLLTNAVQHTDGRYIFIGTSETEQHVRIFVSCEGDFPISAFQSAPAHTGGGLWYAAETAKLHGGLLLLAQTPVYNTVSLTLPRKAYTLPCIAETDFTDWLVDSLSPVYTAFCEICTPRL